MGKLFGVVNKFFGILIVGAIIVGVFYLGTCVYANFLQSQLGEYNLPSESKARYEVIIRNTSKAIYTNEYDIDGTKFTLHGYWELIDDKYHFRDMQITLDQNIFGTITIRRR